MSSLLGAFLRPKRPASPLQPEHELRSEPGSSVAVSVQNVSKAYGEFWALRRVSLEVRKGECLGIVGLNGAGKSTLLQILARTVQPTEGTIHTTGRVVALLDLGAGFNDDFTGRENVRMNGAILGLPAALIEQRMTDIEAFAEIGSFIDKPVRTYSSGMRVRLAFSMLTQVDPDIMIIDEALAVGDAYFSHKCARVIRRFREQGRTLLFVSHDPSAVKTLCDRAVLLAHGTIQRSGTPIEIIDYYNATIAAQEKEQEIRQQEMQSGRRITRSGNRKAVLERFEILDGTSRPIRAILSGSEVKICCVVRFHESIEEPTIGFLIRDRLGNDVFGTNTFHLRLHTGKFAPGESTEVCFTTRLNLGTGNYSLTLAVHSGAAHTEDNYDWFDHMLAFSIIPNGTFAFVGTAALPAAAELSRTIRRLRRYCAWGHPVLFNEQGHMLLYQVAGWCAPELAFCWTSGNRAVLAFELPSAEGDAILELEGEPYLAHAQDVQPIEVRVGDRIIARWLVGGRGVFSAVVPAELRNGEFEVELLLPKAIAPAELKRSGDQRQLALAVRQLRWIQA